MEVTPEQSAFLESACTFNQRFNRLQTGELQHTLLHPFWSIAEVRRWRLVQADWDVPATLVAFYGDGHTLICLRPEDGAVLMLDDARRMVFRWADTGDFVKSLSWETRSESTSSGGAV